MTFPISWWYSVTRVKAATIYFIALVSAYIAIILAAPSAPLLQDYPTWVYEGVAIAHSLGGHADRTFAAKHFPVPNSLSDVGLGVLVQLVGWGWASKVWLCIYFLLISYAVLYFLRAVGNRSNHVLWMIPGIAVANLCFWWGFINFQFSIALFLIFCACLMRAEPPSRTLCCLLIAIFFSHAVTFAACLIALLLTSLVNRRLRLLWPAWPALLLTAWYVYGRFVLMSNIEGTILHDAPLPYMSAAFAVFKVNSFFKALGYVNPRIANCPLALALGGARLMYSLAAVVLILGVVLAYMLACAAWTTLEQRQPDRVLWLTFVALVVIASLSPSEAFGLSDPGARFMVCALVLGVMLMKADQLAMKIAAVAAVTVGVTGLVMFWTIAFQLVRMPVKQPNIHRAVQEFAHVEPESREYYYEALTKGKMDERVFGTAILFNVDKENGVPPDVARRDCEQSAQSTPNCPAQR